MKALVVRQPGGTEVMKLETVPDPVAAAKDVVIKVDACGVCFHDVVTRNGTLKYGVTMPLILGHEIAGTVVDVGRDVRRFTIGQRVCTAQRYHICGACRYCRTGRETDCPHRKFLGDAGMVGGYGQYVAVEDDNVAAMPDTIPFEEASIASRAIGTILNGIRDVGRLAAGERALVTGAGGGLGVHAIQLARLAGAFVVAVTTSPDKATQCRELGADEVVVTRRGEDFSGAVKAATDGHGVDLAIDNVGTPVFQAVRRSIAPGGRWVMIGQLTGEFIPFNPAQLFLKNISMLSVNSTRRDQLEDCLARARAKATWSEGNMNGLAAAVALPWFPSPRHNLPYSDAGLARRPPVGAADPPLEPGTAHISLLGTAHISLLGRGPRPPGCEPDTMCADHRCRGTSGPGQQE